MSRDYKTYLEDMLAAADNIAEYTAKLSFEQFKADQMRVEVILYNFTILGEAGRSLPDNLR